MSEPIVYKLKKPIVQGSNEIKELNFREPVSEDFKDMPLSNPTQGDLMNVASKLCGEAPSVLKKLSVKDHMSVLDLVSAFMDGGQ